jgi:HK97 gp10 family phage protein
MAGGGKGKGMEGMAALERQLDKLELLASGTKDKILRAGVRAGGNVFAKEMRRSAPKGDVAHKTYKGRLVSPGFAARNVKVTTPRKARSKHHATALIGVRSEAFYVLQFVELGTSKFPAEPWAVPAYERAKHKAIEAYKDRVIKRILKITRSGK